MRIEPLHVAPSRLNLQLSHRRPRPEPHRDLVRVVRQRGRELRAAGAVGPPTQHHAGPPPPADHGPDGEAGQLRLLLAQVVAHELGPGDVAGVDARRDSSAGAEHFALLLVLHQVAARRVARDQSGSCSFRIGRRPGQPTFLSPVPRISVRLAVEYKA